MCKLMQISDWEPQSLWKRWRLTSVHIVFIVSYTTHIFHGTIVVLWNKYLIIFSEWIFPAKELLVKPHSYLGDQKHFFVVYFILQVFTGINSHGWKIISNRFMVFKRTCNYCVDVCWNTWSLKEPEELWIGDIWISFSWAKESCDFLHLVFNLVVVFLPTFGWVYIVICNNGPIFRHNCFKRPRRFDIGLIKAWEKIVAKISFKLGV